MARSLVSIGIALLAVACAGAGGASPRATFGPTASSVLTPGSLGSPVETPPTMNVVPQSLLDQMLEQASLLASVPVDDLTVESQEAVTWPDGSLGCPEPGMMYMQVLVDGFRVVIGFGDKRYDFRGSGSTFRLCEPGSRPKPTIEIPPPPVDRY